MSRTSDTDAIALAERILAMLDEGARTATYKLAVLAGLMDLCLENTTPDGGAPDTVTTRQLAEKVVELYWPQTRLHSDSERAVVLRQSTSGQAEIVSRISKFRASLPAVRSCSLTRARVLDPSGFARMVEFVEYKLIEMPIPKLQRIGAVREDFLFTIGWHDEPAPKRAAVAAYQRGEPSDFDNRIRFRVGVGDALVRLYGLLRPILQRKWTQMVAAVNRLEEARLEDFLFGEERASLDPVRDELRDLHDGRCFYCAGKIVTAPAIDHFVPWARHAENAVENLVPAHERCNGQKRDFLAAREHVQQWRDRMRERGSDLHAIAERARFEHAPARVLNVARGIYLRLPSNAVLWLRGGEFETVGVDPLDPLFVLPRAASA